MTWTSLRRLGRESDAAHKLTLAERVTTTGPADLATTVYHSGTTGPAKGVLQTHANHVAAVSAAKQGTPVEEGWVLLLFLPLAHSFARLESFLGVAHGLTTAFAENLDKVGENLREVRPHFICSVPRVFEKVSPCATDRKSTRLNSSHDQISYAVFCLKKKNGVLHL